MYKLLIADDETHIRTGLKNLIEWEIYGIEIVGEAEDGMKAYVAIQDLKPDLVLVDISMPNMTGLQLIELCKTLDNPPKFIILSGYSHFEYVQKAIQLGAANYLLKPVDQDELVNTITSVIQQLDDIQAHQQQFQESMYVLKNNLLMRVLHNSIDTRELREKCQVVGISLHCRYMRVGILTPLDKDAEQLLDMPSLTAFCHEFCRSLCKNYVISDVTGNLIILFKDVFHTLSEDDYLLTLTQLSNVLKEMKNLTTLFALGGEASHSSELSRSYTEALSTIEKKLILGESIENQVADTGFSPAVKYSDFLNFLEARDKEKINETLHDYFSELAALTPNQSTDFLKYHLIELVTYILHSQYMVSYSNSEIARKKQQAFAIIGQTDSILQLEEKLKLFFHSLLEHSADTTTDNTYSFLVQNTIEYIEQNYSDCNLSLKTLAAHMEVNPAYLGREFSHATGEYFNDYLNRIRIAKAKHLLTSTTWKSSKIANSVGFTNVSYFFTIFKKITGQSPKDYRDTVHRSL